MEKRGKYLIASDGCPQSHLQKRRNNDAGKEPQIIKEFGKVSLYFLQMAYGRLRMQQLRVHSAEQLDKHLLLPSVGTVEGQKHVNCTVLWLLFLFYSILFSFCLRLTRGNNKSQMDFALLPSNAPSLIRTRSRILFWGPYPRTDFFKSMQRQKN